MWLCLLVSECQSTYPAGVREKQTRQNLSRCQIQLPISSWKAGPHQEACSWFWYGQSWSEIASLDTATLVLIETFYTTSTITCLQCHKKCRCFINTSWKLSWRLFNTYTIPQINIKSCLPYLQIKDIKIVPHLHGIPISWNLLWAGAVITMLHLYQIENINNMKSEKQNWSSSSMFSKPPPITIIHYILWIWLHHVTSDTNLCQSSPQPSSYSDMLSRPAAVLLWSSDCGYINITTHYSDIYETTCITLACSLYN